MRQEPSRALAGRCHAAKLFPQCPFLFIFLKYIFIWRIIALQYFDGFCHIRTWISNKYTYAPSLLSLPPIPPSHPTPLGCPRALGWAPCIIQQLLTGYLFYIWWCIYGSMLLSQFRPTLSILLCIHKSVLCVCIAIPALQIDSSVPFF